MRPHVIVPMVVTLGLLLFSGDAGAQLQKREPAKISKVGKQIGQKPVVVVERRKFTPSAPKRQELKTVMHFNAKDITNLKYLAENHPLKLSEFAKRFPTPETFIGTLYTGLALTRLTDEQAEKALTAVGLKSSQKTRQEWRRALPKSTRNWLGKATLQQKEVGPVLNYQIGGYMVAPTTAITGVNSQVPSDGASTLDCSQPFASASWEVGLSDSFNAHVCVDLGWFGEACTDLGFSYDLGCEAGAQISCCGGEAWGSCYAEACASFLGVSFCSGCSGGISAGAGVVQSPIDNNMCSYGLPLQAEVSCQLFGVTLFDATYDVSPYSVDDVPCPPAGVCPT